MQAIKIRVSGRWAQFRKPETNNNPLTHDFITKTALIGLMGAVVGIERSEMRMLFPLLSDHLLYGVQVNGVVKKESWAFTLRNVFQQNDPAGKAPRQMEFLRDPDFTVAVALRDDAPTSVQETFEEFAAAVRAGEACYTPVMGLHNCPAELAWLGDAEIGAAEGEYISRGFFLRTHQISPSVDLQKFRLGFERVPTHQDNNWWNPPDLYREVAYPSNGATISVIGEHYRFGLDETWCMI